MKKSETRLGWAIVGLGHQAERIARAISRSKNGQLVAVCSNNARRAQQFAKEYGASAYFSSYQKMIHLLNVDAVFIASPNYRHKEETIQALEAKKHVLCEKPMALNLRDGSAMLRAAQQNKRQLGIGFYLRHLAIIQNAKEIIHSGKIGKLILIEIHWSVNSLAGKEISPFGGYMSWRSDLKKSGGGAITARGVHMFDLLWFLTGLEIQEVQSYTDSDTEHPVDALATGLFRLGDAFAILTTSRRIPHTENTVNVYGSLGRMVLRDALNSHAKSRLELFTGNKTVKTFPAYDAFQKEIEDFGNTVFGKDSPGAAGYDGLKSIAITEAFLKAAGSKKSVKPQIVR